jgi:hypothetical protein
MTTRAQDETIDRIATHHGNVAVRDGFADEHCDVTTDTGMCFRVTPEGVATQARANYSIDWRQQ